MFFSGPIVGVGVVEFQLKQVARAVEGIHDCEVEPRVAYAAHNFNVVEQLLSVRDRIVA